MRAIRKEAYQRLRLRATGMEFASEMVVKACLQGLKMSEVPVVLHRDGRGRSPHLRSFRDGWRHLRLLLLLCPLWLYLIPGTLLFATGLGLMTWPTLGPHAIDGVSLYIHTVLLGALCLLVGYQTLWLGGCSRMVGWTTGLLPQQTFSLRMFGYLNLERGVLAGTGLFLVGLVLGLQFIYDWYSRSADAVDKDVILRHPMWGLLAMALGVQTIFGSFFLSMLSMTSDEGQQSQGMTATRDSQG